MQKTSKIEHDKHSYVPEMCISSHMVRDMYMKTPFYVHMQACNVLKKENWLSYEALLQYPTVADHATVGENNGKELNRK